MRHYKNTSALKFQVLEPRIMFDGAAIFTGAEALDQLENQNSSQIQNDINQNDSVEILLKNKDTKNEIVFIDKGVDDYQTFVNSIDVSKSIYLIDTHENGFEKIQDVLSNQTNVDAIHIVGHANVGQVVLGNSVLNAETINSFKSNLESIGESLTKDGDMLFYGCNLAKGEQGKLFVQQIGNITQADIAASDDITGQGGDWLLEVERGIIEAKNLEVNHYNSSLVTLTGVTSSSGFVVETGTNLRAGQSAANTASSASAHSDGNQPYVIAYEREITSGTLTSYNQSITSNGFEESNSGTDTAGPDISQNRTSFTASSSAPINSYLIYASESSGRTTVRSITFDGEIKGIWFNMENIIEYSGVDKDGATYQTISEHGSSSQNAFSTEKLKTNWGTNITINSKPMDGSQKYKNDWFGVDTDSNTLYVGFNNAAKHGDTIRVFTQASNTAPTAVNDTDSVNEDATVTKTGSQNDVLNDDSDADGDTITVTQIKPSGGSNSVVSSSSTYNSSGTTVTGTYGQLTIGADGSYTYVANQSAADDLDTSDTVTDVFTYTISDGTATATANLTITVTGVNDTPVAVDDTDTVAEDATVTKTGSQNDVLNDDTDADDSATLTVTQIKKDGGSNSAVSSSTTYSNGTSVTGTYGTLVIGADGSYTYTADQTAADALDVGDSVTDTFVYTLSDGTATDTANLVITVTGVNDTPTAQNDVGLIDEGETLTVTNGANANVSGSYDADEEHSGDLIDTSSSSHQDSDPDASPTLRISAIQPSGGSSSSVSTGSSYNSSGTSVSGSYGTLTIGADGSYTYAANDSISGFDANETLTDTFTYTLSDEHDATDTATLTITLLGQDNEAPSATNNTNAVNEDATVTVTNGTSGVTGDVLINDTDPESDTLTVTKIKKNGGSDSNVSSGSAYNSSGTSVTGTYGTLTIGADGSYTYVADQTAADALDLNDTVTDVFVYTVSDGNGGTDTANITITVTGINDDPVAVNDTDAVDENATVTKTGSQNDVLNDDTDADDSASLTVTKIRPNGGSDSTVSSGSTYNSSGRSVTGTYGTLTIGADGSYTYVADQAAADALDAGDTEDDVFVYTVSDGTTPVTATLTITVTGTNNTPVAVDDTDAVDENATVTKTGSQNDVLNDDTDADDSSSLTVTQIKKDGGSNSAVNSGSTYTSSGTSVTGTYGTLTIGADGSYTYVADQAAADALDAGDTEDDVFVYTISDGTATATANLTITVTGINDTPTAQNDVGVITEDSTLTVTNGANANVSGSYDATGEHSGDVLDTSSSSHKDSDLDASASLTVSQIKKSGGSNSSVSSGSSYNSSGTSVTGTYGTLTIGADGSYTYVADQSAADSIAAGESQNDVFVYTMTDGTENVSANITITVLGANDNPSAQNDVGVVNEGATLTVENSDNANVSGSYDTNGENSGDVIDTTSSSHKDSDADTSNTLAITQIKKSGGSNSSVSSGSSYNSSGTSVTGNYGTLTIGADGSYRYVAQSDISGLNDGDTVTDTFTYTLSDGTATTTANISLTVIGGAASNNSPSAVNDTDSVNEDATVTKTGSQDDVLNDDSDSDGDTITVNQIQPSGGSASSVSAGSTYNSSGTSVTGTYGTLTMGADGSYTYVADQAAADDLDANDTVTDIFTYRITDGTATDTANLTITVTGVNDTPAAVDDTDSVNEDATVTKTGSQDDVLNDDTDADDSASLVVTNIQPSGGSSSTVSSGSSYNSSGTSVTGTYGTLTIGADGSYTYTADQAAADALDASDTATDVFTYTLSDGSATDTATLTITVTGINDDPVAVNDTDAVNEDATITKTGSEDDVLNDDTDADDSSSLTVTQIKKDGGSNSAVSSGSTYNSSGTSITGTYGTLTIGADGSYTYVADQSAADDLDAGDTETDVFVYTVSDGTTTQTANLTITVTGVNDTPTAVDDTDAVNEDATITKTGSQDDVLNDDTDADDSASLNVSAIQPSGGSSSTVSSGTTYSNGTSVTGTYGTLTIGADGSYTYVADQAAADALDASDTATDVFTYTLSDGTATDTATLTITVTGVNDTPVAVDDTDSVNEDATVTKTSSEDDVLNDDTDADDSSSVTVTQIKKDGGSNSAVSSGSSYNSSGTSVTGTYGTLTIGADGSYTYVADQSAADDLDAGDQVTDVFTYTVSDGSVTDTANITITVTGVNDTPSATNDTDSVNEDETVTKTGAQDDLLNDDSDADDSASLSVTNISHSNGNTGTVASSSTYASNGTQIVGTYGTLTVGADGSYTYTADQDAADSIADGSSETDVFTYTLSDGSATDTATITITVSGADNEVAAVNDTGAVDDDSTLSVGNQSAGVLSNDTDNGSAALSVGEASVSTIRTGRENASGTGGTIGSALVGTYGSLTLNSDGTYDYTANTDAAQALAPAETAVDYFTYTISDGTSTDTAELQITVTGINDAPTSSTPATIFATENQSVTIQTKTFFSDPDPSSNSYGQLTYSVSGLPAGLSINSNGKVTGIVTQGTYTFTVTATDGGNLSTQQTFTLEVAKSNDVDAVPEKLKINKKNIEKKVKNKTVVFEERSVVEVANLEVAKDYSFNGGMRVVDVAVEDLSNTNSNDPTPMSKSFLNEGTILGFAIGDDYKINVKQYTATMENGSAVPDWVKVDPKTGQTLVQFPDNIYSIDIKIIAIDKDNTTREIDLTLDQSSIKPDKSLKRSLENFIDRSSTLKSEVFIDNNGKIQLNALNKNQIDLNRTANLNNSEIVDIENNSNNNSTLSTLKLASIDKNLDKITVKIDDDKRNQVVKYSLSIPEQGLTLDNQIPNWLKINAETGEIEAIPPQGLDNIKLQIIAEDEDGTLRTLEVDLDLSSNDQSKLPSKTVIDTELEKFASLQDQIHVKYNDYENYGDKIVKIAS